MSENTNKWFDPEENKPSLVPAWLAAVLSAIVPGLGQVLARQLWRGVLIFGSFASIIGLTVWRFQEAALRPGVEGAHRGAAPDLVVQLPAVFAGEGPHEIDEELVVQLRVVDGVVVQVLRGRVAVAADVEGQVLGVERLGHGLREGGAVGGNARAGAIGSREEEAEDAGRADGRGEGQAGRDGGRQGDQGQGGPGSPGNPQPRLFPESRIRGILDRHAELPGNAPTHAQGPVHGFRVL